MYNHFTCMFAIEPSSNRCTIVIRSQETLTTPAKQHTSPSVLSFLYEPDDHDWRIAKIFFLRKIAKILEINIQTWVKHNRFFHPSVVEQARSIISCSTEGNRTVVTLRGNIEHDRNIQTCHSKMPIYS